MEECEDSLQCTAETDNSICNILNDTQICTSAGNYTEDYDEMECLLQGTHFWKFN